MQFEQEEVAQRIEMLCERTASLGADLKIVQNEFAHLAKTIDQVKYDLNNAFAKIRELRDESVREVKDESVNVKEKVWDVVKLFGAATVGWVAAKFGPQ